MKKKTLLIIGGTGFFGKSIIDYFAKKKFLKKEIYKIIILSRKNKDHKIINSLKKNFVVKKINKNILNLKKIPYADYVIYCALLEDLKKDHLALKNYCYLAKKYHLKSKILYTSSGAIYGKQPINLKKISEKYLSDNKAIRHENKKKEEYAKYKFINEKTFEELKYSNIDISIARCFTFVGKFLPRGFTNITMGYFAGNVIDNILKKQSIFLTLKNNVYRSYMYADELVGWLFKIVKSSNINCPIYNVGSDNRINIYGLAKSLSKKYNLKINIGKINKKKIDNYVPNTNKIKNDLKLNTRISSLNAIVKTIKLLREDEKKN
jgi:nucleoside-diphosphate-sugar epimerase